MGARTPDRLTYERELVDARATATKSLKTERETAELRETRGVSDVVVGATPEQMLALGYKLRILTIVDTHSRLCPATDARSTYRGVDVVQMLERVCRQIGYPKMTRVYNGEPSPFLATLISGLMPMR